MHVSISQIGMKKHARSGYAPKSPKFRYNKRLEAERAETRQRKSQCVYQTVEELFS